jgi:beta-carotene ketolase (CrtW type)
LSKTIPVLPLHPWKGVLSAVLILLCWVAFTVFLFGFKIDWFSPWPYLLFLVQMHLFTGLFITAHDAMHGVVSNNKNLNTFIGFITTSAFLFNNYFLLYKKHHEHHKYVNTDDDPDYHKGGFFLWYFNFLRQYVKWQQIVLVGVTYNLLKLIVPVENLFFFWMIPAMMSTLQLFYFGTYLPHRGHHEESNKHKARSQKRNHVYAFLTCYFFGYHYEHHSAPYLPWWRLAWAKNLLNKTSQTISE